MERNYKEDQANEVEALESIYCDDIEGKSNSTVHHCSTFCFVQTIRTHPTTHDRNEQMKLFANFIIGFIYM